MLVCIRCNELHTKIFGQKQTNCINCGEPYIHQCKNCLKRYRHYSDLTIHFKYKCGKKPVKDRIKNLMCDLCPFRTWRKHTLKSHQVSVHQEVYAPHEKAHCCNDCGKVYKTSRYLRWHMNHECSKKFTMRSCPICDYQTRYSLTQHMKIHTRASERLACTNCSKQYKNEKALRHHMNTLCGKEPQLQCEHCDYKAYVKYPQMAKHIQINHPSVYPDNEFDCKFCSTKFNHVYSLNQHFKNSAKCAKKNEAKLKKRKKE